MDTEIEIKIPLDGDSFLKLKKELKSIARFVKKTQQTDDYYTPAHRNFMEPEFPFEWLSIRKRSNKSILNYKHFHPENVEEATHCDEFESEIKNQEQLDRIFSVLNLKKLVRVEKEREVYIYNKGKQEFEIALDTVKELGRFIEIEAKGDSGSVKAAREKLFEFAKKLEIDISKTDKRGYPFLLMKKKGLIR